MRRLVVAVLTLLMGLALSSCYVPDQGPFYPVPTTSPQPGDEWVTKDGTSGLRLNGDGTATMWGIPWYSQFGVDCANEHFTELSDTGAVNVWITDDYAKITVAVVTQHDETGFYEEGFGFYNTRGAEGWQELEYEPCNLFNDGRGIVLSKRE